MRLFCSAATACATIALATTLHAQTVHNETEPNDNKTLALANGPVVLAPGDTIVGTTTGATVVGNGDNPSADYYLLKTIPAALGIYRHRLLLTTTTAGHFTNFRGISQWDST